MAVWLSLFKKDFRMGRGILLIPLISIILMIGLSEYLRFKTGGSGFLAVLSLLMVVLHSFFLIIYFLRTIRPETRRLHLWLHNPLPGYALLGSKLLSGFVTMLISLVMSLLILFIALYFDIHLFQNSVLTLNDIAHFALFLIGNIMLYALHIGLWLIFYWMIYLTLKTRIGKGLSITAVIILYAIISNVTGVIKQSNTFTSLTNWAPIHLHFPEHLMMVAQEFQHINFSGFVTIYLGNYLLYLVVGVVLYLFSSWLLDHKIEV